MKLKYTQNSSSPLTNFLQTGLSLLLGFKAENKYTESTIASTPKVCSMGTRLTGYYTFPKSQFVPILNSDHTPKIVRMNISDMQRLNKKKSKALSFCIVKTLLALLFFSAAFNSQADAVVDNARLQSAASNLHPTFVSSNFFLPTGDISGGQNGSFIHGFKSLQDEVSSVSESQNAQHIFIDADVRDSQVLYNAVEDHAEIFHLFSHGRPGELLIDGTWMNANEIASWIIKRNFPNDIKQVNIYGCNFAQGDAGRAAITILENRLGLRIAASDDITGADGDWDLEIGDIRQNGLEEYAYNLQATITSMGTDLSIGGGALTDLFDASNTNEFYFTNNQNFTIQRNIFTINLSQPAVLTSLSFQQDISSSFMRNGVVFRIQGFNTTTSTWDDVTANITSDGNATGNVEQIDFLSNTISYQQYRIRWISGGSITWDPYIRELTITQVANASTLGSNTVPAATVAPGSLKVPIQSFTITQTGSNVNLTGLNFITTGTYVAADLSNFKLWTNTTNNLGTATQIGSTLTAASPGTQTFAAFTQVLTAGQTRFFWITMDVASPAIQKTIAVNAVTTTNITTSAGNKLGTSSAGGIQTLGFPIDTDGDGVDDSNDLDDDNDGILDTDECSCVSNIFDNGSFEQPVSTVIGGGAFFNQSLVPGWSTTAGDNNIELWRTSSPAPQEGSQFAELNATQSSTLYQTFCVSGAGGSINWSIWHRGRSGTDVARVLFGPTLGTVAQVATMTTGNTAWVNYTGTYNVPIGQTQIVIAFQSVSTASGDQSIGNYIDNVQIQFNLLCQDTDGDGISNSLDNDSDNDGCADAIEGGGSFIASNIDGNGRLTGGVNATTGIPTLAGAGQTVGQSQLATQLIVNTAPSNQTVTPPAAASFSIATTASSNTSWSGPTGIPVYGTPGNANAQTQYQWYLGDPDAGGTALTNTGVYSGVTTATLGISNSNGLIGNAYYVVVTNTNNQCIREVRNAQLLNDCSGVPDTDADGVSDACDLDDDNDGILDTAEEICAVPTTVFFQGFESGAYTGNLGFGVTMQGADMALYTAPNGTGGQIGSPLSNGVVQACNDGEEQCEGAIVTYPFTFSCGGATNLSITGTRGIFMNSCNGEPNSDFNANGISGEAMRFINIPMVAGIIYDFRFNLINVFPGSGTYIFSAQLFNSSNTLITSRNINVDATVTGTVIASAGDLTVPTTGNYSIVFVLPNTATGADFLLDDISLTQRICDTDQDGLADQLDNDSDNDGCADAIEGGGSFTAANLDGNDELSGGVNGNGIPLVAAPSGQTVGSTKVATQLIVNTAPVNQTVTAPAGTSFNIATTASNNTSWSGPANARVPVYGTPGNANAQTQYQWYLGDPDAGGTALTNTGVYSGVTTATLGISNSNGLNGNVYYVVVTHTNNPCIREVRFATLIFACSVTAASSTPTVCVNSAIPSITHNTTSATGIGAPTGLPTGVSAVWSANVITISGTPTAVGVFNYSIPLTGGTCTNEVATGTITVNGITNAGTIAANQTICSGTAPAAFTSSAAATGTGAISYQWQNSIDGGSTWNNIGGATSTTYTSGALTQTTQFRRLSFGAGCTPGTASNVLTVTVNGITSSGVIAADQTICSGTVPAAFTSTLAASGSGAITYQWQSSIDGGSTWNNIALATNTTYASGALTQTTQFRRLAFGGLCPPAGTASNIVTVTVNGITSAGTIAANQTICSGATPAAFTSTAAASGAGTITYQWQNSIDGGSTWNNIAGVTSVTYASGPLTQTTQFRRLAFGGLCPPAGTASNIVTVTVNGISSAGTIAANQTICSGDTPAAFTSTTAASGSGAITYQWQSSIDGGASWNNIGSATSATYASGALTQTTQFRRLAFGGLCPPAGTASNIVTVTVNGISSAGTIAANQTICSGDTPAAFTSTTAASGSGAITYQWQSSIDGGASWNNIGSATSATYASGALTQTTQFRRLAFGGLCPPAGTASNIVTVTVNGISSAGTIAANQTICSGDTPAAFTSTTAASGSGAITYQWQSSIDGGASWNNIGSATSATYASGALTQTTQFRRLAFGGSCPPAGTASNVVTVTVNGISSAGTIAANQTICSGDTPAAFTSTTAASGSGAITYQWQSSIDGGASWNNIGSATSATYASGALTQTTQFRRLAFGGLCPPAGAASNVVTVTVNGITGAGTIAANQTICSGDTPAAFTSTTAASGSGAITYQWQSSIDGGASWNNIGSATSATYASGALTQTTQFRRLAFGGLCPPAGTASNVVTVTVNGISSAGTIAANQTICSGNTPAAFTSTTAASGSGAITYQWQSSIDGGASWNNIGSATSATYASGALTQTTQFRRLAFGGLCPPAGTASNVVTVTVNGITSAGTIAGDETICSGDTPAAFTLTTAASGSGAITYQWQSSIDGGASWNNIGSATSATYASGALTQTTQFRRLAFGGLCPPAGTASNVITITVNGISSAGTIAANQTICSGATPAALTSTTLATGTGSITYQWQSSINGGASWNNIGAVSTTYISGPLTQTTQFRRLAFGGACPPAGSASNVVTVTVNPNPVISSVVSNCTGGTLNSVTVNATVASGILEYSSNGGGTYQPSNTFSGLIIGVNYNFVVRLVGSTCTASQLYTPSCSCPTVTDNTVSANQTICIGNSPAQLTGLVPTTNPVTPFTYQWQSSASGSGTWSDISGANAQNFTPGVLSSSTDYRRQIIVSGCSPFNSNVITITVEGINNAGVIATNQTICSGTAPAAFTSTADASGSGAITYQWQSSIDGGASWNNIALATNTTYASGALTQTTQFRRLAFGGLCPPAGTASNVVTVTVNGITSAGTIAADQTICSGATPAAFTSTTAASGSGAITYQWQSSIDGGSTWNNIAGVTSVTYASGPLTQTTQFRRLAFGGLCPPAGTASNVVTVTVNGISSAGTIAANQTICSGNTPAAFTSTTAASGSGAITYQWQSSIDGGASWNNIALATNTTYASGALTQTTQFRRLAFGGLCPPAGTASNVVTVTVNGISSAGTIAANQTICSGDTPAAFTSTTAASGSGAITYQWQSSIDGGASWTDIGSATSATYASGALTQTTQFRRLAFGGLCPPAGTASNIVTVTVNGISSAGTITADQTICSGATPAAFTSTTAASGSGAITYQWQSSIDGGASWNNIGSATSATYASGALTQTTQFRRLAFGGLCPPAGAASNIVTVTVNGISSAGTIAANQTICSGDIPAAFTSTTAASGSGAITYQWQSSIDGGASWNNIGSATSATYASGALTQTTQFRRLAFGGSCPPAGTASNLVTVTVNGISNAGTIAADQTICSGTAPAALISITTASGSGTITYQWQSSIDGGGTWIDLVGATGANYISPVLGQTTQFRRLAFGALCPPSGAASNVVTVTVNGISIAGTIADDQIICSGTAPAAFTSTAAASGSGVISYQWQNSIDGGTTWNNISGASSATYTSVALTQTTQFRRLAFGGACPPSGATSNVVTVTVNGITNSGLLITSDQTICSGDTPAPFTSTSPALGIGTVTYQWQSSINNGTTWQDILGATGETYSSGALTQTTQFRRLAFAGNCPPSGLSSNVVTITVNPLPAAPTLGTITQPTCGVPTGSVSLSGLPAGNWSITRIPGNIITTGNTSSVTITGLPANGSYVFTVTASNTCTSLLSASVAIDVIPSLPAAPTASLTQPTCAIPSGSIVFTAQAGVEYSINGGLNYQSSNTFSGLAPGSYNLSVRNLADPTCSLMGAAPVVINALPASPILTITGVTNCIAGFYSVEFATNAGNVTPSAGIVSGNTVINIPVGTNLTLTASTGVAGCVTQATITGPASCPVDCEFPELSTGNAICQGAGSYIVAFNVDPNNTTLTFTNGVNNGNGTATGTVGTNMVITATNGTCVSAITIVSPTNCAVPCINPSISVSDPVCASGTTYQVSFTAPAGTVVNSSAGFINSNTVQGITIGTNITLTATLAGCTSQSININSPASCAADIAIVKTATTAANPGIGDTINYTFTVTNTGNVTLTNIFVSDPLPGISSITPVSVPGLVSGASAQFTAFYVITQSDVLAGLVSNQALATGTPAIGPNVTDLSGSSNATDGPTVVTLNTPPVAVDDNFSGPEDAPISGNVSTNDNATDGPASVFTVAGNPANGTLTFNNDGTFTYTPNANFTGTDTFTYSLCDGGAPDLCDTATVTITVNPLNDGPSVNADNVTVNEDTPVVITVLANDTDVDGSLVPNTVSFVTLPTNGTVTVNPVTGAVTYTPNGNFTGTDSFIYLACDNGTPLPALCDTALVTINVTPLNDAPVAVDDNVSGPEDAPISGNVSTNDNATDGPASVFTVAGNPANGTLTFNNDGTFTYTPNANFTGTDTFTYSLCDGGAPDLCDTATVTITVNPLNDAPSVNADNVTVNEDTPVVITVLANDTDVDGTLVPNTVSIVTFPTNGTVTVNPVTGAVTYTPNGNFTGTDSFIYLACDNGTPLPALCDTAVVTINVTPLNDAPVAVDDLANTAEDSPVVINIPGNDTDPEGNIDLTSVSINSGPTNGTVSVDSTTGQVTYTPNGNFNGFDSFTYTICDTGLPVLCDDATVTINVTAVNDPPVISDTTVTTPEDTPITVCLPISDTDLGNTFTAGLCGGPSNGTISGPTIFNGQICVTYTPTLNYNGPDSLCIIVCDNVGACDTATININVTPINDPPVAVNDFVSTPEDAAVSGDVSTNDNATDGPSSDFTLVSGTTNGTLTFNPDGTFSYTPNLNFEGTDNFTYSLCDGGTPNLCDTATVSISVIGINNPPVANADTATTPEDAAVTINVLANDTDVDGTINPTSVSIVSLPANGSVFVNALTGQITYTPNSNFNGTDNFIYLVCDNGTPLPSLCDTALVTINVTPLNDGPVAVDDNASTSEETPVVINVPSNDTDVDGNLDNTSVTVLSAPTNGTTSVNILTGEVTYTPNPNFTGADSFTYSICDLGLPIICDSATVFINVLAVNDPPFVPDTTVTTPEDTAIVICLPITDPDVGNFFTAATCFSPSGGTITGPSVFLNEVCITYTPITNFNGPDSLCVVVCDNFGACDTSVIVINVTPVNDPPIAVNDNVNVPEDASTPITVLGNDSDVDGNLDPTTVAVLSGPTNGSVSVNNTTGVVTYTPNNNFTGTDVFTYVVCDTGTPLPSLCDSATVFINVLAVNDPPFVPDTTVTTPEDTAIVICLPITDPDVGNFFTAATCFSPSGGTITGPSVFLNEVCITYTPITNFNGPDSLCVVVCDNFGACDTSVIVINVTPVNDPPIAVNDNVSTPVTQTIDIIVTSNDFDVDGNIDTTTVAIVTTPTQGTVIVDPVTGVISYTPNANACGVDSFTYVVFDDGFPLPALSDTATVSITLLDNVDPSIVCPSNLSVNVSPNTCAGLVVFPSPVASDNCANPVISGPFTFPLAGLISGGQWPVGIHTVTYVVTDAAGNNDSCLFEVTVIDNIAPVIAGCPIDITLDNFPSSCSNRATWVLPTVLDNCSGVTMTSTHLSGQSFPVGTTTVTYTATDLAGNVSTCSFDVIILDSEAPVITGCPTDITVTADAGLCETTVNWIAPIVTDNCTLSSFTQTHVSGSVFPVGVTTVTYTATDSAGNITTCSFDVSVQDNQLPLLVGCPSDTVVNSDAGICGASVNWTVPTVSDNCGSPVTLTSNFNPGDIFPVGTTTVTYTATDSAGNSVNCSFNITVNDINSPVFVNCPTDITVNNFFNLCERQVYWTVPTVTDNCGNGGITLTASHAPGFVFPVGNTVVTYIATDAFGNADTCSFNVTVIDAQSPLIQTCPSDVVINNSTGLCGAQHTWAIPNVFDNCPGVSIVSSHNNGAFFPLGSSTVTYIATDASGNSDTCSFTVTVIDSQAPVIAGCPTDIVSPADAGQCNAVVNWLAPTATDNCTLASFTSSHNSGDTFPVGTTTVVYTAVDSVGNISLCNFTVTVIDNVAPIIVSCPTNISVNNDSSLCGAVVTWTPPTFNNNCSNGVTLTSTHNPGDVFPVGTTTVTYTATDSSGNVSTCSFVVTVADIEVPIAVSCPTDIITSTDFSTCGAAVSWTAPVFSDNCSAPLTITSSHLPGQVFPLGTTTITYTATDNAGNSVNCVFTVTVNDTIAPVIVACPQNITVNASTGTCDAVVSWTLPSALDNCPGTTLTSTHNSGDVFPIGTTTVVYTATDAANNVTTCSFTVTVNDTQAPVIAGCPANISAPTDAASCNAVVNWTAPTAGDNCTLASFTSTHNPGDVFPVGTTTVTYTAVDSVGLVSTCSFTVTVNDTEFPTFTGCPTNITVSNDAALCGAVVNWVAPVGSDNCAFSVTQSHNVGAFFPIGTTTVTYTITDAFGNTATCSFNVTVNDTQAPTVTNCPTNVSVNAAFNACGAPVLWTPPVFSDNCSGVTVSATHLPGTTFPVGTTTVTYTAVDAAGNTSICSFNITVVDVQAPVIVACPINVTMNNNVGVCGAVYSWVLPTALDNCPAVTLTSSHASGTFFPVGVTTVTYTATDASGNTATCSFNVTVVDNELPIIANGPSNILVSNDLGDCSAVVNWIDPTATDNCGIQSFGPNFANGSTFPLGSTTVIYTAVDLAGNISTHSFVVTVIDNELPVATGCPQNISINTDVGVCGAVVNWTVPSFTDNCAGMTVVASHTSGSLFNVGTTTIVYTATDQSGNSTVCSFTVMVADNEAPIIVGCPSNITVNNAPDICGSPVNWTVPIITDNCSGLVITSTHASGDIFPVGITQVSYTATDASGNSVTCSFNITVLDVQDPVIVACPINAQINNNPGQCGATYSWILPNAIDNCPVVSLTGTHTSGTFFPVGATTITYTAIDATGNTATCSFVVTVVDSELPLIANGPADITVSNDLGNCSAVVNWTEPTATDNCAMQSFGTNIANGSTFQIGVTTVTYTAIDSAGNIATHMFVVTVIDDELPVVSACPSDIPVSNDPGDCSALVTWTPPTATDNCSNIVITSSHNPGDIFPVGTTTVTYTFTDNAGNVSTCTFDVVVSDDELPVTVNCPSNINSCEELITWTPPTFSDNCTNNMTITSNFSPGSNFPVGATTVVYTATDAAGNSATCSFVVRRSAIAILPLFSNISCNGSNDGTATVIVNNAIAPFSFNWGASGNDSLITALTPGDYTVIVTDAIGCSATATITIAEPELLVIELIKIVTGKCGLGDGSAEVIALGGTEPYNYIWSNQQSGPIISYVESGVYGVTVTDANGCTDTLSVNINCNFAEIPQLVTPNGDGHNDTWIIPGIAAYPEARVELYNRWGNKIYDVSPYQNNWEGYSTAMSTIGKGRLPAGTYFYVIQLSKDSEVLTGYIELQY